MQPTLFALTMIRASLYRCQTFPKLATEAAAALQYACGIKSTIELRLALVIVTQANLYWDNPVQPLVLL